MGNNSETFSKNESLYNLSDKLVHRLNTGYDVKDIDFDSSNNIQDNEEVKLMKRLKSVDATHSAILGLTERDIYQLIQNVENQIRKQKDMCLNKRLLECYKNNLKCPLNCHKEAVAFEDCVDYLNIMKVQKLMMEENKEKQPVKQKRSICSWFF